MAKAVPNPPPGFDELSTEEKIDYVQSLWERVVATTEEVPVPEWHKHVLEERLQSYHTEAGKGEDWEQIREKLRRKLRDERSE